MTDIVLVRNSFAVFDPRVFKIVSSLSKRYSICVLGWNREEFRNGIKNYIVNLELFNFRAPYGKPSIFHFFYMTIYFALFWVWVLIKLIKHRPMVVHACDLDVVLPCFVYKLIFRKKMVFDVFDRYAMTFIPKESKLLYSTINLIEELFSQKADVLITISEKSLKTFRRRPKQCAVILNCAMDHTLERIPPKYKDENVLTIIYTGAIKKGRSLENIVAAIKNLKNVKLVIAGMIVDNELLDQIAAFPNVDYQGFLYPEDCLTLERSADVMIALYDLRITWNSLTTANKVFEAMMCGIPIIANVSTELVKELDFGIIVDYDNINEIRQAIALLRDNTELRLRLGRNGRNGFIKTYNWTRMEDKLYEIYNDLIQR